MLQGDEVVLATVKKPQEKLSFNSAQNRSYMSGADKESNSPYEVAIIKRFDFEASLQRMSVIGKNMIDKTIRAYVKGSPEKIADLCLPYSIPDDFHSVLETYTK